MAADGVNKLKVLLVHGQRKHDVTLLLPHDEVGDCLTVGHLVREVEKVTGVFERHQKLFFNGRVMCNHSNVLSHMGVKQGSKILLIGRPNDTDNTTQEMTVRNVMKRTADVGKEFSNFVHELDGVNSGQLCKPGRFRGFDKLRFDLRWFTKQFKDMWRSVSMLDIAEMTDLSKQRNKAVARLEHLLCQCEQISHGISSSMVMLDCKVPMYVEPLKRN